MYPEDRVFIGVMPNPDDLVYAREQHWYRVPVKHAPQGIHAEYVAFYFTKKYPPDLRWGIYFYARRTGHEMVRRVDLLPDQPQHPHAQDRYYKLQLGPLKYKEPPIISMRWRRITFIQTTWDRFVEAREVNDLFRTDDHLVDRLYHILRDQGLQPEREIQVKEGRERFTVDMLIPCKDGAVMISSQEKKPQAALTLSDDETQAIKTVQKAIKKHGGPIMVDLP